MGLLGVALFAAEGSLPLALAKVAPTNRNGKVLLDIINSGCGFTLLMNAAAMMGVVQGGSSQALYRLTRATSFWLSTVVVLFSMGTLIMEHEVRVAAIEPTMLIVMAVISALGGWLSTLVALGWDKRPLSQ